MESERTGSLDDEILGGVLEEHPAWLCRHLQEIVVRPDTDPDLAYQVIPLMERLTNDYFVKEVLERGMAASDPEVRRLFAERVGMMAARNRNDAYGLLRLSALEDEQEPDLVEIGLRAVKADAATADLEFIIEKGLRKQTKEIKPGAIERQTRVNDRFRASLERMGY